MGFKAFTGWRLKGLRPVTAGVPAPPSETPSTQSPGLQSHRGNLAWADHRRPLDLPAGASEESRRLDQELTDRRDYHCWRMEAALLGLPAQTFRAGQHQTQALEDLVRRSGVNSPAGIQSLTTSGMNNAGSAWEPGCRHALTIVRPARSCLGSLTQAQQARLHARVPAFTGRPINFLWISRDQNLDSTVQKVLGSLIHIDSSQRTCSGDA